MIESQGLGGNDGQLMVSLFGARHILSQLLQQQRHRGPRQPSGHYVIALPLRG
jgi:hypothetical protein